MSNNTEDELFSQDESYQQLKDMLPFGSQELTEIMVSANYDESASCSFIQDGVKREVSIPLSPPMTPTPVPPFEAIYHPYTPVIHIQDTQEEPLEPLVPTSIGYASKAGRYNFHLNFEEEVKAPAKSCNHTYSNILNKIFVQREVPIPIEFKTTIDFPSSIEIRAYLVYDDPRHAQEVVEQCPLHVKEAADAVYKSHLLRTSTNDVNTTYQKCPLTGRYICVKQYKMKQPTDSIITNYTVSCHSSCRGGINRRQLSVYFAFYIQGVCHGQAKLPLTICACPGRDRRNQEAKEKEKHVKKETPCSSTETFSSSSQTPTPSTQTATTISDQVSPTIMPRHHYDAPDDEPKTKKKKVFYEKWMEDDNKWYTIHVQGKQNASKVATIAKALNTAQGVWRVANGISSDNGLLLTNHGYLKNPVLFKFRKEDSNELKFEKLKKKCNVRSTPLERCQSDPCTGFTAKQRLMQLTLPPTFFTEY